MISRVVEILYFLGRSCAGKFATTYAKMLEALIQGYLPRPSLDEWQNCQDMGYRPREEAELLVPGGA